MSVVALRPREARPAANEQNAAQRRVTKQLELFALRCFDLADRVRAGELSFVDAVDMAESAAVWADLPTAIERSGLIDRNISGAPYGDDVVQAVLATAFADVVPT